MLLLQPVTVLKGEAAVHVGEWVEIPPLSEGNSYRGAMLRG